MKRRNLFKYMAGLPLLAVPAKVADAEWSAEQLPSTVNESARVLMAKVKKERWYPIEHWSDCAVHNEPAYPNGPCNCGGYIALGKPLDG